MSLGAWYGFMSTFSEFPHVDDAKSLVCRATRPADFSYKHDAKHNSLFTVARIWDDVSDESILKTLGDILKHSKVGTSPTYSLYQSTAILN